MKTQVLGIILLVGILAFVSCQKEEENSIPTPALIVDPPEGAVSTTFTFDATQSTDEQDPSYMLEVRWDWDADGRWDTEWTTEKVAEFSFGSCSEHPVKLEIRDTEGWSNIAKAVVKVHPDSIPPTAQFIVRDPSGQVGNQKQFDASPTVNASPYSTGLRYRWDFDGDMEWDTPYSPLELVTYDYDVLGSVTVTMEAINSLSLTDTFSVEIFISN